MSTRPKRKPRILYVIGSMREGGAESDLVLLMEAMRRRGYDVYLLLLHYEGVRLPALLEAGFHVIDSRLPRFRPRWSPLPWLKLPFVIARNVRIVRHLRPDLIHACLFWAHLWAGLLHFLSGTPARLFTTRQQLGVYKDGRPWMQRAEDWVNRRTWCAIANSEEVRRDSLRRERLSPKRFAVVYGGVDAESWGATEPTRIREEFPALRDATCVAAIVANIFEYKGYFDLLEAWKSVREKAPGAKILCVGADGGAAAELRRRIDRAGLADHMVLAGSRRDVPAILAACDFAVLASHEEGFPRAIIEAMASGRAVVATRVGGAPESLLDGVTGLLVPPRDPAALAEAIVKLAKDRDLRERMGAAGRARVAELFSLRAYVEGHLRLYEQAIRGENAPIASPKR